MVNNTISRQRYNFFLILPNFLPFCDRIVVYLFCNLGNHRVAELILNVREHLGGIKRLVSRICLLKALFWCDIVGKSHFDGDG